MTENKKKWFFIDYIKIIPGFLIAGIIIYFSSLPNPLPPVPRELLDLDINTILHMCEFATFAFFVAFGFFHKIKIEYLLIFTIVFAFLDEVHQYFVPNRFFDVYDVIVDSVGVILGFIAYIFLFKLREKFNQKDLPVS